MIESDSELPKAAPVTEFDMFDLPAAHTYTTSMKKLVIQIPCFNEEQALPVTLAALPRNVPGYDSVEVLVVDDGSTDKTVEVAKAHGAHHVVSHGYNRGLARSFMTGLEHSLSLGAHTIVNLDADNQYCADDIPTLTAPIINGNAVVVIGTRPINSIRRFSLLKKLFQHLGSWVVRVISGTHVEDAPSGFRAIRADIAQQITIFSHYSYTVEMVIGLGQKNIPITCVPVRVNETEIRPSRLMRSNIEYVLKSATLILRMFVLYKPIAFFSAVSITLFSGCALIAARYLYLMLQGSGGGHVQSLMLAIIMAVLAGVCFLIGLVCDSAKANRQLMEEIRLRLIRHKRD